MVFTSADCLNLPCPSAASVPCHVGLHAASFHPCCFPRIQQDPSVNRAYRPSFSDSLFYSGTSSAHATSYSGDILKSLPSDWSMITSKIPGQLGFLIQDHCRMRVTYILHVASVAWCVEVTFLLNIQPSTSSQGVKRRCAFMPTTSKADQMPTYAARISFPVWV